MPRLSRRKQITKRRRLSEPELPIHMKRSISAFGYTETKNYKGLGVQFGRDKFRMIIVPSTNRMIMSLSSIGNKNIEFSTFWRGEVINEVVDDSYISTKLDTLSTKEFIQYTQIFNEMKRIAKINRERGTPRKLRKQMNQYGCY